jgi:hypothetical protein
VFANALFIVLSRKHVAPHALAYKCFYGGKTGIGPVEAINNNKIKS